MTQLHYFLSGNTSQGYVSLLADSLKSLQYLIVVDGPYSSDNAEIMERFLQKLTQQDDIQLELIHQPSAPKELQAIFLPQYRLGIISSTPTMLLDTADYQGPQITMNIYDYYDLEAIEARKIAIEALSMQINHQHSQAYACYKEALLIHDEWESIYIQAMDFSKANAIATQLSEKLIPEVNGSHNTLAIRRFLGAATPVGAVDYVPNLTEGLKKFFIKGRPGSGKSTLLKKIVARGKSFGYPIEIYQCGLDSNSLDMVICRELGFAIFDSTAPHEYYPTEPTDELIDMYADCIAEGTDERFANELQQIMIRYKLKMNEGNHALALAHQFQLEQAKLTSPALKRDELSNVEELVFTNIKSVISFFNKAKAE